MKPPTITDKPADAFDVVAASAAVIPQNGGGGGPSDRPLRVAVVTPIPTPYRDPFWNELARRPDVRLSVFYCAAGKSDRPWRESWRREYRSEVLGGWNLLRWRGADASCFWNPSIGRRLAEGRFDALLIGGYNHVTMWAALWFAVRNRVPYFLMCESHLRSHRAGWKQWLKRPVLRWIVKHASGFLPTGSLASDFLRSYGAEMSKITKLPNVPDVVGLAAEVTRLRVVGDFPGPPAFGGRQVVLFVGRLIPKKRAELVIRAFHEIHRDNDAVLAIVGDGPLRTNLEELVNELELGDRVHFAGFVEPDEVRRWYAQADLFVLPSSETWGVAVIEALSVGLPVVISDEVGCHVDLVVDPVIGTVVPAGDLAALGAALRRHLGTAAQENGRRAIWSPIDARLRYDALAQSLVERLKAISATSSVVRF